MRVIISNRKQRNWFRYAALKVKDSPDCFGIDDCYKPKMIYASDGTWMACFDGQRIRGFVVDDCIIIKVPILNPSAIALIQEFIKLNLYRKQGIVIGFSLRG